MKFVVVAMLVIGVFICWCCLRIASLCDDTMGYDNVVEEERRNDKI